MKLIKKLFIKLFRRKREKYFAFYKELHRHQLLEALQITLDPDIHINPQSKKELLELVCKEFGVEIGDILK